MKPFVLSSSYTPNHPTVLRTSNMQNKRVDPWKRDRHQNTCNVFQLTCGFPVLLNWWWIFLWFTVFNPGKSHLYVKFHNGAPPNSFCVLHTACRQFLAPHWSAGWAVISHHGKGGGAHRALTVHQNKAWGKYNLKLLTSKLRSWSIPMTLYTQINLVKKLGLIPSLRKKNYDAQEIRTITF